MKLLIVEDVIEIAELYKDSLYYTRQKKKIYAEDFIDIVTEEGDFKKLGNDITWDVAILDWFLKPSKGGVIKTVEGILPEIRRRSKKIIVISSYVDSMVIKEYKENGTVDEVFNKSKVCSIKAMSNVFGKYVNG